MGSSSGVNRYSTMLKIVIIGIVVIGSIILLTACDSIDQKFAEVVNDAVGSGLIDSDQAKSLFSAWKAVGSVPWLEMIGSVITALLGNVAITRLWRGSINQRKGNISNGGN